MRTYKYLLVSYFLILKFLFNTIFSSISTNGFVFFSWINFRTGNADFLIFHHSFIHSFIHLVFLSMASYRFLLCSLIYHPLLLILYLFFIQVASDLASGISPKLDLPSFCFTSLIFWALWTTLASVLIFDTTDVPSVSSDWFLGWAFL